MTETFSWKAVFVSCVERGPRSKSMVGLDEHRIWTIAWAEIDQLLERFEKFRELAPGSRTLHRHRKFDDGSINEKMETFLEPILVKLTETGWLSAGDGEKIIDAIHRHRKLSRSGGKSDGRKTLPGRPIVGSEKFTEHDIQSLAEHQFDVFRFAFRGQGYCTREIVKLGKPDLEAKEIGLVWYFRMSEDDPQKKADRDIEVMTGKCVKFDGDVYFICEYTQRNGKVRRRRCLLVEEPPYEHRNVVRWGVIVSTAPPSTTREGQPIWGKSAFVRRNERITENELAELNESDFAKLVITKDVDSLISSINDPELPISIDDLEVIFRILREYPDRKNALRQLITRFQDLGAERCTEIFEFIESQIDSGLLWYDGLEDQRLGLVST